MPAKPRSCRYGYVYVVASEREAVPLCPLKTEPEPESIADQVQTQASHALSWVKAVATRSPMPSPPRKNEVHSWIETVAYGLSKAANSGAEQAISVQHAFASDPMPICSMDVAGNILRKWSSTWMSQEFSEGLVTGF